MKKISFLFSVILSSIVFNSYAQLGIQAGLNLSSANVIMDEDLDAIKSKFAPAGFLGVHYTIDLGEKLYLEPAFQFNMYRYAINVKYPDYAQDNNIYAIHAQIPVHLGYKLNISDNKSLKFFAGPYFSYGITGKINSDVNDDGNQYSYNETIYFGKDKDYNFVTGKSYQNPLDMGAQIGVGIDLGRIALCGIYSHGFSNTIAHSDDPLAEEFRDNMAIKYRQIQAAIYYSFGK